MYQYISFFCCLVVITWSLTFPFAMFQWLVITGEKMRCIWSNVLANIYNSVTSNSLLSLECKLIDKYCIIPNKCPCPYKCPPQSFFNFQKIRAPLFKIKHLALHWVLPVFKKKSLYLTHLVPKYLICLIVCIFQIIPPKNKSKVSHHKKKVKMKLYRS